MFSADDIQTDHDSALAAHRAGRLDEAARGYRGVLARQPDHADALNLLALVERDLGNLQVALDLSRAAVARFEHPTFLDNLGVILLESGDPAAARAAFLRGLVMDPDHIALLKDMVRFQITVQDYQQAAIYNHRLLKLAPNDAQAHSNLGALAQISEALTESEYHYRCAIALDPASEDALLNLSGLLLETNRLDEAEIVASAALEATPASRRGRNGLGHVLLARGEWERAWPHYEFRAFAPSPPPSIRAPRWSGESLAGKRFLILGEQGIGDHLQFARYGALLKAKGAAHVTMAACKPLHRLLLHLDGIDAVTDNVSALQGVDVWAPLMSLGRHCATTPGNLADTLPHGLPYIRLPPGPARQRGEPLRVGLFWAGGHEATPLDVSRTDRQRSLAFHQLLPTLLAPELYERVVWTILQKDRRPDFLEPLVRLAGWNDPFGASAAEAGAPADLLDTARIITGLDLVIGVDSALIHLSAALAKPTWMMDRWNPCWRWSPGATTSDWYPGALQIFRQHTAGDWSPVLTAVRNALGQLT